MSTAPAKLNYHTLLAQVQKTLIDSQRRIDTERIKTYWETGRLITADILRNKSRAEYGTEIVKRLADDLNIHVRQLNYCIRFFKVYPKLPIMNSCSQFKWSHYRALLSIDDDQKRLSYQEQAVQKGWTVEELLAKIQAKKPQVPPQALSAVKTITPLKRGRLYTYANTTIAEVFALTGKITVDCGFNLRRKVRPKDWPKAAFKAQMDYTYRAHVSRVIDGDTLKVQIDCGLGLITVQTLRLRAIDCPEIATPQGVRAKRFVQRLLKDVPTITIVTQKSDKYDRYLADVWVGDVYLNQRLLDEGLAKVWGE